MNFGAEGERLQQLRRQETQQYADELRRQIAEKQGRNVPQPSGPPRVTEPRIQNQGNTSPRPPSRDRQTKVSPRSREPIPNLAPAAPALPRPRVGANDSAYADRLRSLESIVRDYADSFSVTSDAASRIRSRALPQLHSFESDLRARVDRLVTSEIATGIHPVTDVIRMNNEFLDSVGRRLNSSAEEIAQEMREMNNDVGQMTTRIGDVVGFARSRITELRGDVGRAMDQYGTVLSRLAAVESRAVVRGRMDFSRLEERVEAALRNLQGSADGQMMDGVNEAAREIRAEGDACCSGLTAVARQVADVNQRAIDGVAKLHGTMYGVTGEFKEATAELARVIGTALDKVQEEMNESSVELSARIDDLIGDAGEGFKSLESEITATVATIRRNFAETRKALERAIEAELKRAQQARKDEMARYEVFEKMMIGEIGYDNGSSNDYGADVLDPVRAEIRQLKAEVPSLDETEAKIENIEKQFQVANKQVQESIVTLTGNYEKLAASFADLEKSVNTGFVKIEEQVNAIVEEAKPGALQERMKNLSEEMQKGAAKRIEGIETKISSLSTRIEEHKAAMEPDPRLSICQLIHQVVEDIDDDD